MILKNLNNNLNSNINFQSKKITAVKKAGLALAGALMIFNSLKIDSFAKSNIPVKIEVDNYSTDYYDIYMNSNIDNEKLNSAINKANSYLDIPIIGGYLNKNKGNEKIKDVVREDENLVNGYIDEPVIQGIIGDCWLLSAVNNLSYTEKGSKILHNAINVNNDGNIEVYFKGPDKTYTVTKDELKEENENYTLLSVGDDDMLVLEIAARKYRQDLLDGKIKVDKSLPKYLYFANTEIDPLNVGEIRQAYWLLTGILDSVETKDREEILNLLEKFKQNPEKSLMDFEFSESKTVKDINGKKVNLDGAHGYGVKKVDDKTITLVSASNSVQEIKLPIETVLDVDLLGVIYCSLDDVPVK